MSAARVTRLLLRVGFVASLAAGVALIEYIRNGFWFMILDCIELGVEQAFEAFRWVAVFIVFGRIVWLFAEEVTRRDLERDIAAKTGRRRLHEHKARDEASVN